MEGKHREEKLLEEQIGKWRGYLRRRQSVGTHDITELEDHLREQVMNLRESGLDTEEAFLVTVKRMGNLDALSREFAREHSDRLWKQLVIAGSDETGSILNTGKEALVVIGLAIAAAIAIKVPIIFEVPEGDVNFYALNFSLLVLPFLAGYFAWKRQLEIRYHLIIAMAFIGCATFVNVYPFSDNEPTLQLTALHLPIMLWLMMGIGYTGAHWRECSSRMDYIRFSGELFIYYTLIALGGGVLMGFSAMLFEAIGIQIVPYFELWILPCGAAGAVLIASWLVEAKKSVIENMAPVLTRLFTPLFALMLLTFLGVIVWTGRGLNLERDMLIAFDLLLVVVLGLLLYSISARDPHAPCGVNDYAQVVLVVSALLADALALWAIAGRIGEFGLSANRVMALGLNLILLVNLAGSVVLSLQFIRGRIPFGKLENWQTSYLPVFLLWAATVVFIFPFVFA